MIQEFCHGRGRCHAGAVSSMDIELVCTSCDFGYLPNDNCESPLVLYYILAGVGGMLVIMVVALIAHKLYAQSRNQKEQDKALRTSRKEICELTAAWKIDHSELIMKRRIDLHSPGGFGEVSVGCLRPAKPL